MLNRKPVNPPLDIDYRLVLLGSLLPDIIDKCILFFLAGERFKSGRLFAHSLLFLILLFALGITIRYAYKKSWGIILAACVFIHQILDMMWMQLNIFLWPVYDFLPLKTVESLQAWSPGILKIPLKIPAMEQSESFWSTIIKILFDPYIFISEFLGALIMLYFVIGLFKRKQIINFLKSGKFYSPS